MTDNKKLLAQYAANGSESAFQMLVERYVNMVYSTALRLVNGDTQLAQDVTQTVFITFARKARTLSSEVMLGGWLHQCTVHVATRAVRGEVRRQTREREAIEMNMLQDDTETHWRQIAPILDEAIGRLEKADRTAILLRFFEQLDFRAVGEAIGSNEDAARMRVNRALEKLHASLKQRGVTLAAVALGTALTVKTVAAAPVGLAATVSSAALAGATGTGITFTILKFMTATQLKLGIGALVVAGTITAFVVQHQEQQKLRAENESLRNQIAQLKSDNESLSKHSTQAKPMPRLPAPAIQMVMATNATPTEEEGLTNLYSRFKNGAPKLTAAQVEAFLKANRTNAASLLAAYRTGSDPALLKEAMEKFPNDPQVAFEAALSENLSSAEQRQWLNTFEQVAPDNALANYMSAFNYFNAGQIDQGIEDLNAASGKQLDQYTLDRAEADEEAYLSAGYSPAEAERISDAFLEVGQLPQIKQLGVSLVDLANAYGQSGDQASAQATYQMAINLGQQFGSGSSDPMLINQLVGLAIEKIAFSAMDPSSPYGNNGQTVQDQLTQINQYRASITQLVNQATPLLPSLSDQDILSYENIRRVSGEIAALQWVANKYGQQ